MTSIIQTGNGIGGLVCAPLTGWLITSVGWRPAYIVLGIMALAVTIPAGLLLRSDPSNLGQYPYGAEKVEVQPVKGAIKSHRSSGLSLREALRTNQFWLVFGIFCCFGFCRSAFLPHIAAHTQDLGFTLSDGANMVAALTASSILGRFGMGGLSAKRSFGFSFIITAAALVWVILTQQLWGLYLFSIVFGFSWGVQAVLRFTLATETVGLASLGLIIGFFGFGESISAGVGSYLSGFLFDVTNSYRLAFLVGIPVAIIGSILSLFIKSVATNRIAGEKAL